MADLDSQMQEQERIINISYALASEASQRSKQVAGEAMETGSCSLPPGTRGQSGSLREKPGVRHGGWGPVVCSPVPQAPQGGEDDVGQAERWGDWSAGVSGRRPQ